MESYALAILGVIQGLTEFLPVSSSGHIILFGELLQLESPNPLYTQVFLHAGTLFAVLIFFYKEILSYIQGFLKSFTVPHKDWVDEMKMPWYILASTGVVGVIGLSLDDWFVETFYNPQSVAFTLIAGSLIFLIAESWSKKSTPSAKVTFAPYFLVGISQALALMPGLSRSGITIAVGMFLGLSRIQAARYTFILSVPIIAAGTLKLIFDIIADGGAGASLFAYMLGGIFAGLSGYFAIRMMIKWLERFGLVPFIIYRIILAVLVLILI
jgi:undecaprenyl-diphosphatase